MKFYSLLILLLVAQVRSKSILPEGFTLEGLEGIDLNSLLSDDDQARQLSAITDRLKNLLQGTLSYLQNLRRIPQYIANHSPFRRPGGGGIGGSAQAAANLLPNAANVAENMITSGSEVVPSVVDTSGNPLGNFFRRAMRAAWGKRGAAQQSSTTAHNTDVLKGLARIAKTLTNSKMILGQLHKLTARNGMKQQRVYKSPGESMVLTAGLPAPGSAGIGSVTPVQLLNGQQVAGVPLAYAPAKPLYY